jgi:molecular chaperone GrpE
MTDQHNGNQSSPEQPEGTSPGATEASREVPGAAAVEPPQPGPVPAPSAAEAESIVDLRAERDRLKDGLLRAMADLDNYRKRARREADEAVRKAREDVLRDLLPVFDNLDRAAQYIEGGADAKAIGKGVEMVLRLFEDTLVKLGGRRLHAVGQPFDPAQHEAIQQVESAEHPAGTVVREELVGYSLNDRLLRPAMVVVSRGAPTDGASG